MQNVRLEYVTDEKGNKRAVMIPIDEWEKFEKYFSDFKQYLQLKERLKDAFKEVDAMEKGEQEIVTLKEFLDEL